MMKHRIFNMELCKAENLRYILAISSLNVLTGVVSVRATDGACDGVSARETPVAVSSVTCGFRQLAVAEVMEEQRREGGGGGGV